MHSKRWQYVRNIGAGIGIAVLGAAAYDFLAKPAGKFLLATYSSISESVRDQIYWDAALDPRTGVTEQTLADLVWLYLFVLLGPMLTIVLMVARDLSKPGALVLPTEEQARQAKGKNNTRQVFFTAFVAVSALSLIVSIEGAYYGARYSQSVVIWRTFHTNLARCAPYISEVDRLKFLAEFASMGKRSDYERIDEKLRTIAQQKGVTHIQVTGIW